MSFVIYEGMDYYSSPIERITRIGDEPVEYHEADSQWGMLNPKWSHKIPGDIVKSIGGKPVEYDHSFFRRRTIIRVGDEPVVYSSLEGLIAWIGDKEVITSSLWGNRNRISTIGGKPVYYSVFPDYPNAKINQLWFGRTKLVSAFALGILMVFVMILSYEK